MHLHERFLEVITEERDRIVSRRGFLTGSAKLAAGGAAAVALASMPVGRGLHAALAQDFANDLDVFNYALTLEHLEYAFYRDGLKKFSAAQLQGAGFSNNAYKYFGLIRDHEKAHVDTITSTISAAGGTPVGEAMYDFGYGNDVTKFVATASALEETGVSAYTGAAASISDGGLLTAALTIQGVEARHASYLALLNGKPPIPDAFATPKNKAQVLAIAGPLIVAANMPATGTGTFRGAHFGDR